MREKVFKRTIELVNEVSGGANADAKASAEAGKQSALKLLVEKATGLTGNVQASLGASGGFHGERIAKTIIENTLLYDFLDSVEFRKRKPLLDIVDGFKLSVDKESMTYYAMIAPITQMMDGHQRIDDVSNITMTVSKMNEGIRGTKGYYELIGEKADITRVFRFNIDSFKNNYRIQDLRRMNLTLYSIHVGETKLADLKFETEFELNAQKNEIEFNGFHGEEPKLEISDKVIPVFDVILAGVK
ncbi:DUF6414 family protein [Sporosarcina sp. 179-K 8C2 HS]|uniref:DUF6414 family protein n=1 Tax=Sporosarcina sp. 179-K 8C2 HS TaxID=3142387 RepID=UPI0039A1D647